MKSRHNATSQTVRTCEVFISYRRDGGDMVAMYFYQALKERGYRVFYDLEVLRAGKFNEALLDSIQSCQDFVLILSPHALDRCGDENDWVRKEIAEALRCKKNIIPVMMKGFEFPEKLPEDIDEIRYQNGLTCTTEYFEESINRLCSRYLNSVPAKDGKTPGRLLPVLAVIAVIAVAIAGILAFGSGKKPAPDVAPEPTVEATVELTAAPTAAPTDAPTAEPAAKPTEEPGAQVVRDTSFPVLSRAFDEVVGDNTGDGDADQETQRNAPVLNHPTLRRRDVSSVTFMPSLDGAPEDAWDVSEAGDGRVLAWIAPKGELYDLTIAGDGGVKIVDSKDASRMFESYLSMKSVNLNGCVDLSERTDFGCMFAGCYCLEDVDLTGICTENATNLGAMFAGCWALEGVDLSGLETRRTENMAEMFQDCGSLRDVDISGFDTSRVTDMHGMFQNCEALRTLELKGIDTSWVKDFRSMFENCRNLRTLDVSGFDTGRAEAVERMFADCRNLEALDVSGFDTSRVEWMAGMFYGCERLRTLDVSGFDTRRVIGMFDMFWDCRDLEELDVSGFDTARVEDMGRMFFGCNHLEALNVSGFDTGSCIGTDFMFASTALQQLDVSGFDTSHVIKMDRMFMGSGDLVSLDLSGWDVSQVEDMTEMFEGCHRLETIGRDPEGFMHGITNHMYSGCDHLDARIPVKQTTFPVLSHIFDEVEGDETEDDDVNQEAQRNAPVLNHPTLRRRDVASVTFLSALDDAPADAWDVSEAGDGRVLAWTEPNGELYDLTIAGDGGVKIVDAQRISRMFRGYCSMTSIAFNGCVDTSERQDFSNMFAGCHKLKEVDLTGICTENATCLDGLFAGCWELESVDLSGLNTSHAEFMQSMFLDCGSMLELDLSGFDTARVVTMNAMFYRCERLEKLDVSGFDTAQVTDFSSMFEGCASLPALALAGWDVSQAKNMSKMFKDCGMLADIGRDPSKFGHGLTQFMYSNAALKWSEDTQASAEKAAGSREDDQQEIQDSWEEILAAIDGGAAPQRYAVGMWKPLDLGRYGVVDMQLVGFDLDDKSDGSGKAATTWIARDLLPEKREMNSKRTNEGGWEASDLRAWLQDELLEAMPATVRDRLLRVTKTQWDNHNWENQSTQDAIWIPDFNEMFGLDSLYYGVFRDESARRVKMRGASADWWWLRSAGGSIGFRFVGPDGTYGSGEYSSGGVALGFCL